MRSVMFKEWIKEDFNFGVNIRRTKEDPYKDEFDKEIEQLVNEYKLKVGRKRYALEEVWEKCEKFHDSTKQCFISITKQMNDVLPLGRVNGYRFIEKTRKEMDEEGGATSFLYEEIGIRGLLDSYSCGSKVMSWRNHIGYAVNELCGCVPCKPLRDFTRPLGTPSGLKGLLHMLNTTGEMKLFYGYFARSQLLQLSLGEESDTQGNKLSILAKDKGFGQEMHQIEEPKALYGVTSLKDYAVTYSNEEMSHNTLYGVKCLQDYAATFKYTRDDVSDSALRRNICDRVTS
ncbi:hypothetical protein Tco_0218377 [Tanacetum coccineum]